MEIQNTASKFETVNGKKTGKSFSFKADPKKLAVFKTEATLKKKIKEYVAKSGVFKKEELDDVKYNMKDWSHTRFFWRISLTFKIILFQLQVTNSHISIEIWPIFYTL